MKLEVHRSRILVVPEGATDEAYLEEVLQLKQRGDQAQARRVDAVNLSCWAYLEITAGGETG